MDGGALMQRQKAPPKPENDVGIKVEREGDEKRSLGQISLGLNDLDACGHACVWSGCAEHVLHVHVAVDCLSHSRLRKPIGLCGRKCGGALAMHQNISRYQVSVCSHAHFDFMTAICHACSTNLPLHMHSFLRVTQV